MSGELILVIDDSAEIVKHLTQHLLPTFGYRSLHAFDGHTGLDLIREENPDLVMLDYNLPNMTGLDILRQMIKESVNIPVVLMTGYGSEVSAIEAFRLGAKDYLIKPFTVDEIVETIDRALVEKRLLQDKEELAEELRRAKVEMSRLTHEMNMLSKIGKAITSLLSVDKVLARVLETATYLTDSEESTIWMPDSTGKFLHAYRTGVGLEESEVVPALSMSKSVVGQVMQTGTPMRRSDFSGRGVKVETGFFARAVLYMPLKLRSVTVGVLSVSNISAQRAFSRRDEFLLSFLSDYAAIALENARVFQATDQALAKRLEELNTLIQITHTITSSLDLDEVVRLTIQQVHESWNIEACSLWWVDTRDKSLRILANVGTTPHDVLAQFTVPAGEGFVGNVAGSGKWIYTNDAGSHPLHYKQVDDETGFETRSVLSVPLLFAGEVVGVLQLLNKLDGEFDDQDVEKALSIAAAVAIALTNAVTFKETEQAKQHLEATLEHSDSPTLILDNEDRLLLLNEQARSRLGLNSNVVGRPASEALTLPELAEVLNGVTDKTMEGETQIELPDGSIWIPHIAPIPGHGRILVLQEAMSLGQLEKARDRFVAGISHDMRAPLNTISGFAAGLRDVGPLNEEQDQFVDRILRTTEHMAGLVNGLLELAKVSTGSGYLAEPCDIVEILTGAVSDLQSHALVRNIELVLHAPKEIGWVKGNPHQLHSAIHNLVDNAIKFSPDAGRVDIDARGEENTVVIKVEDHGEGIAADDLPHIFDKFYRGETTQDRPGSGLGLALVRSIARAHNGEVWAEHRNGDGSAFFLRLPLMGRAATMENHN